MWHVIEIPAFQTKLTEQFFIDQEVDPISDSFSNSPRQLAFLLKKKKIELLCEQEISIWWPYFMQSVGVSVSVLCIF